MLKVKALIMAAGKGTRISKEIGNIPKCTLPTLDGTPIIRRSVRMMLECDIEPILCIGYQGHRIRQALDGLSVKYYENPFFSITNNIVSLWFARDSFQDDDILLVSADLYYPKEFLKKVQEDNSDIVMIVDSDRIYDGDFYFSIDKKGRIIRYGPNIPASERDFEYMGMIKIGKNKVEKVRQEIEKYIQQEKFDRYFEDMVISLNQRKNEKIELLDVKGSFWREFDYYKDYQKILNYERSMQR